MGYKDVQKQKDYQKQHYQKNKKLVHQRRQERRKEAYQNAYKSLLIGAILDMRLWKIWFNDKDKNKSAYELSATEAFNLIKQRCFYCGDFATTLDRLDSNLTHTVENCVGCCECCNKSKGAQDPLTFILQSVYRRRFVYYKDEDIWLMNTKKPRLRGYKENAFKQGQKFELTEEQFEKFITDECHYCKRSPSQDKFFGIDKLVPDDGYTMINCVTACASCNYSKRDSLPNDFALRDEHITERYLAGYFDILPSIPKNISVFKL